MLWVLLLVLVLLAGMAGWLTRHRSGGRDVGSRIDRARGINEGRAGMYDKL